MSFGKKKQYAYRRKSTSHLYFLCFRMLEIIRALILNNKNVKLYKKLDKIK